MPYKSQVIRDFYKEKKHMTYSNTYISMPPTDRYKDPEPDT